LGRLDEKYAMSAWNLEKIPIFLLQGRGESRKPNEKWKIGGQLGRAVSECCIEKYCEDLAEHSNSLCGMGFNVKGGDTCNYH